jgi:hypothetical protein
MEESLVRAPLPPDELMRAHPQMHSCWSPGRNTEKTPPQTGESFYYLLEKLPKTAFFKIKIAIKI